MRPKKNKRSKFPDVPVVNVAANPAYPNPRPVTSQMESAQGASQGTIQVIGTGAVQTVDTAGNVIIRIGTFQDAANISYSGIGVFDTARILQLPNGYWLGNLSAQFTNDGVNQIGNLQAGNVTSDTIVQVDATNIRLYVDATNGLDTNDGVQPKAYSDTVNATGAWGGYVATDTYHTWIRAVGTAGNLTTVSGSPGTYKSLTTASTTRLMSTGYAENSCEVKFKAQLTALPAASTANASAAFGIRDSSNYYFCRFQVTSAGVAQVTIVAVNNGTQTLLKSTIATSQGQPAVATNTDWWVKAQCIRNLAGTYGGENVLRIKVWRASDSEPPNWDTTCTDTNSWLLHSGGCPGIGDVEGATANTRTWTFSSFSVTPLDDTTIDDPYTPAGRTGDNVIGFGINAYGYGVAASTGYPTTAGYGAAVNPAATSTGPLATIGAALAKVPPYFNGIAQIIVDAQTQYNEDLSVRGLVGAGEVYLMGSGVTCTPSNGANILGTMNFAGLGSFFRVTGMVFSDQGGGSTPGGAQPPATVFASSSRHVELYACGVQCNGQHTTAIMSTQGSDMHVENCQVDNSASFCLVAQEGGFMFAVNNKGTAGTQFAKGQTGGIMQLATAQGTPASNIGANGLLLTGGSFIDNSKADSSNVSTANPLSGGGAGTPPPVSTKKTIYANSNGSGSYRDTIWNSWRTSDDYVLQGSIYGSARNMGHWRYPASLFTALNGKTISAVYITMKRVGGYGSSSAQTVYCFLATSNTLSGTPAIRNGPVAIGSIAIGQTKTFLIPASIISHGAADADFCNGTARNIGIYIGGGSPYMAMYGVNEYAGSGRLKVTYT